MKSNTGSVDEQIRQAQSELGQLFGRVVRAFTPPPRKHQPKKDLSRGAVFIVVVVLILLYNAMLQNARVANDPARSLNQSFDQSVEGLDELRDELARIRGEVR